MIASETRVFGCHRGSERGRKWLPALSAAHMFIFHQSPGATMKFQAVQSLLLSCMLLSNGVGAPQEAAKPATTGRPKLGIVLEGGGALGLAHIGVLQWLEEHRIPVTYIAGTSMGGLVGGIYATGSSPAEIRRLVHEIKWDEVIRGQVPFQDLSYRRKEDAVDYPNGLGFGIKRGIQFP